jgi:hypothetical protein
MVLQAYAHKAASDQSISLTVRACHAGVSATDLPIKSRRMRWSRGLKLCRAFVRDASPERVLSDPPQIPAPVRAALATSQPVQQVGPIVPADQLLYRTHWLADETLLWQRDQSNHEPKRGNGLREIENR